MKRQTLLSAARPHSLPPRGIILFFDLSNNTPAWLAVMSSTLPDVSIIFHTFLTPTAPLLSSHLPLMISFIWQLIFSNVRTLTHTQPPPSPICFFGSLGMLCRFGSDAPQEAGNGGWGVLRSHDHCTSYQTAAAASWRHLQTSITAEQDKPHKEPREGRAGAVLKLHMIGTHCSCCGMTETRCSRQCFNINFLTFLVPANSWLTLSFSSSDEPWSRWHLWGWKRSGDSELTPPERYAVWFGLGLLLWWPRLITETNEFKFTKLGGQFNISNTGLQILCLHSHYTFSYILS